jgi:endonuclease-3
MSFSHTKREKRALEIFHILKAVYPNARPLLNYKNAYELLVSTILAAQCTDERVNTVTPRLFKKYPDPHSMLEAREKELEEIIRPTGFFRNKTRNLKKLGLALVEKHQGQIPDTIEELVALPGIGRKTANVIVGYCFNQPAVIVDTHFKRVCTRLELTDQNNPDKIEKDIRSFLPQQFQTTFSGIINFHGRYRCKARKPLCISCEITHLCPYPEKESQP